MPKFSSRSLSKLQECDSVLIHLFKEIIKYRDCTILTGYRDEDEQNRLYELGFTKVNWPYSKHNTQPEAQAVDVAPFFENRRFKKKISFNRYEVVEFGHYVLGFRDSIGLKNFVRWGGDWDNDFMSLTDNEFLDAFHWELI